MRRAGFLVCWSLVATIPTVACLPREKRGHPDSEAVGALATADDPLGTKTPSHPEASDQPGREGSRGASARKADPLLAGVFVDGFEREGLGGDWRATGRGWKLDGGMLCGQGARNHPVWLNRRLPTNARVRFEATSLAPEGDIKAEYWGDGRSAAAGVSYDDATSYLTIFGGWKNRFHVLARIDEHAPDRPEIKVGGAPSELRARPVEMGRKYSFKVERRDSKTVTWWVDDIEMLKYSDEDPLQGPGHEYFGFNNWEVRVCFDNLEVTPLGT